MKLKITLFFVSLLLGISFVQAQVIEVVGTGVHLNSTSTLNFSDLSSIDHVVVEAIYKDATVPGGQVHFYDNNESYYVDASPVEVYLNATPYSTNPYYFTATFNSIGAEGITLDQLSNFGSMHSFVAYVYRNIADPDYTSYIDYTHVFMFKNGESNAYDYVFPIGTSPEPRDIHVNAVISEMAFDNRICVINVTAGAQTVQQIFSVPNLGNALNITPFTLSDVQGDVSEVTVTIYSPPYSSTPTGDSFISGGVVLDVEEPEMPDEFCTLTQGFYGNYGGKFNGQTTYELLWDLLATDLVIGGNGNSLTLTQSDVDCLIERLPGGGPSATLNGNATCDNPVGIQIKKGKFKNTLLAQTITLGLNLRLDGYLGDVLLSDLPFGVSTNITAYLGNGASIDDLYALANDALADEDINGISLGTITGTLGSINDHFDECQPLNGSQKPGKGKSALVEDAKEMLSIYPNPVSGTAQVEFTVASSSLTTVNLYDLQGRKIKAIYQGNTIAGETYSTSVNASDLTQGLYILILRNGDEMQRQKLQIK